jgi:glycosyltransferase involved in cell wall biosynthesis
MRDEQALARVSGSLAGLCLLRDLPNYRVSLSTKIVEYCALGVSVIPTPLPLATDLVGSENVGFVVPCDDPSAVVDVILKLRAEPELRCRMGANGHKVALHQYDWDRLSGYFVGVMNRMANRMRDETSHDSVPNRRLSSQDDQISELHQPTSARLRVTN